MAERRASLLATIGKRMLGIRTGSGCCGGPAPEGQPDGGTERPSPPAGQAAPEVPAAGKAGATPRAEGDDRSCCGA